MQAQLPSNQQHPQHQYHPQQASPQAQYPTNGNHSDLKHQHPIDFGDTQHTTSTMNPYHHYSTGGYGQPQQQHQPYLQQSQQSIPQQQRPYMPPQLPPLGAQMGSMPPVRSSHNPHATSSANTPQPSQYTSLPPQTMPHPHPQAHQSLGPPIARPTASAQPQEKKMSNSLVRDGFKYALAVVQQPQRARMCGFGDKDRRPITPPPCVRLVITDVESGREVDVNEIASDPSFFVLQVDLWAESADREANVVRASSNSPAVSISSATTTSYPPPADAPRHIDPPVMYMTPDGHPIYSTMGGYGVQLSRPGMMYGHTSGGMYYPPVPGQPISYMQPPQQPSNAMYTRNLIGSLTVNASRLTDTEGKLGYWFVLQDLSVRTEGFFRLRMSFIDISNQGAPGINRGKAPVLAWTFSDKFQVYSAKKFPGVIESTPLSKCFAGQGIKIPIRKDNKNEGNDDDDLDP